ncbi:MAG: glucose-1-phosphate adenylyltransferase subunit GlgD [Clostridia bacterium]|nr:glucose-1-phosphate adenylyltransferase subunit GlgD [Clostridia bacterium]
MNNMMSILFASGNENKLNELTLHRTTASLPFGGRYRLIDFTLSNLVNSGVSQIGIITSSKYQSLMDHIRQGRDWDLNRKNAGISVFPPFVFNSQSNVYRGKIEAIYSILDFLEKSKEDYVVIANCNIATNLDYEQILEEHIKSKAKVTMLTHNGVTTTSRRIVVKRDEQTNKIVDIYETERVEDGTKEISLNSYIIEKNYLMDIVKEKYAHGIVDFETGILFELVKEGSVYSYFVNKYAAIIDDVKTYYTESMNLLEPDIRKELFGGNPIYTKVKDSVPTKYGDNAVVKNSLLADGCEIYGTVENSILFRKVKVARGAVVKNSIIMENGTIQENAQVSYAITDKDVVVSNDKNISGYVTYPIVIVKGKTV